jgi:hypothetical protein
MKWRIEKLRQRLENIRVEDLQAFDKAIQDAVQNGTNKPSS